MSAHSQPDPGIIPKDRQSQSTMIASEPQPPLQSTSSESYPATQSATESIPSSSSSTSSAIPATSSATRAGTEATEASGLIQVEERAATPTYEEIVEMILNNKTPAGIKDIPDKVLGADSASESRASPRPKPWESRQGTPS